MEVQKQEHLEGVQSTLRVDAAGEFSFFYLLGVIISRGTFLRFSIFRVTIEKNDITHVQDDISPSESQDENVIFV